MGSWRIEKWKYHTLKLRMTMILCCGNRGECAIGPLPEAAPTDSLGNELNERYAAVDGLLAIPDLL
jgi:hypothetical protein